MQELINRLRDFAKQRDWEQYHSPKNLAMALSVEVAELVEHFQWLTQAESCNLTPEKKDQIKDEIGDVLIYLTSFADKFGINPVEAAKTKINKNEKKYPVELSKGKSQKYTEL